MFEPNKQLAINSKKEIFVFQLTQNGEIKYDIYNSSLIFIGSDNLYQKNILKYTILIDENDSIHLIALLNTGDLNYYKYDDKKWVMGTISKFDLKSNIYNQFEILIINNKLHFIYNYSNLINSNIWTIQHVILGCETEEVHNVTRYIAKKVPEPFIVDADSQGNIHLLYSTNLSNNSQIYYSFYSPYTKVWSTLPKQISLNNANNLFPFLLVDLEDNLHSLWVEEENNYQLKYLRMSSKGKEKYIWKEIKLPYILISQYPIIIFEQDKTLNLYYISYNTLQSLISTDYGNSWINSKISNAINENISIVKVTSNLLSIANKIKFANCNLNDSPKLYFFDNYLLNSSLSTKSEYLFESNDNESTGAITENNIELKNELHNKIELLLDFNNNLESIITKILSNQKNIEHKLDNIQDTLNQQKQSFFSRIFNSSK